MREDRRKHRVLKTALAALLVATMLPLVPGAPETEKAEALEGTTDYSKIFTGENVFGKPAGDPVRFTGSTAQLASTLQTGHFILYADTNICESVAVFVSERPVSLYHSWQVEFDATVPTVPPLSNYDFTNAELIFGLQRSKDFHNSTGSCWSYNASSSGGSTPVTTIFTQDLENSFYVGDRSNITPISWGNKTLRLSYDAKTETGTMTIGTASVSLSNLRQDFSGEAYLFLMGCIEWGGKDGTVQMTPPANNMQIAATFKSMSLPNLDPKISNVKLYRADGTLIDKSKDTVQIGEKVRVECTVQNTNSAATSAGFEERYPMHLKGTSPTQGVESFADGTHKVVVTGPDADSSASYATLPGASGVPITLVGTKATTVSYWATITGTEGAAVVLSQALVEDSFQGISDTFTSYLVDEHPLNPGDGTGSGAGTAWHYTRLPAANENGWNSSPVSVQFYGGNYNTFTVTPAGGDAPTVLSDRQSWTRAADTDGYAVSMQASNALGAVSAVNSDKVKIDTSAPRIEKGAALAGWTVTDAPTAPGKATSGVWRLHRTTASGASGAASTAAARAAAYREFALAGADGDRKGNPAEGVGNLPNGWYVAEDAAGNRSTPVKVSDTEPPSVERPDPTGPDAPPPVGPVYDPEGDEVPPPIETEDGEGLRHAVIDETVTEIIDPAAPPFGGALDMAKASAMMDYRYSASSAAGIASTVDELLDASGNPIASLDTKVPGACLVRRTITDSQGNTTTINLRYRCVRDSCPPVSPLQSKDPADPDGPKEPGDPLQPDGPVSTDPDGSQHAEVSADVTEAVSRGAMGAPGAEALLRRHFALSDADGGTGVTVAVQSMEGAAGNKVSAIDLSRVADYKITYLVRDTAGNTTTVRLGYHLVSSQVPGVVVTPDPGEIPVDPQPGDDPLNPEPRPVDPSYPPEVAGDGTQHAVIEDEMRVKAREGASLSLADARSLVQRRYSFTPEGGGAVTEVSLALADAAGSPVAAVDESRPGSWLITYKVADANGNTVTVRLRYLVVSDPPEVIPTNPGGGSGGSGGTGGSDPEPLPPTITVDPETGLSHAIVEDRVVVGTHSEPATAAMMAELFAERYELKSALADGKLAAGPMRLYDAAGNSVSVIDRSEPGMWRAEQLITDSAGNTTLIRLAYEVVRGDASGSVSSSGDGGSNGNDTIGANGTSGKLRPSDWATGLRQLPQTGGPFGTCPLHMLFVLLMLLTSAYALMRLRQEKTDRDQEVRYETVR